MPSSPVQAITDSVKLISANVGDALLLALLSVLVLIAGAIALLVGLVVAYPVVARGQCVRVPQVPGSARLGLTSGREPGTPRGVANHAEGERHDNDEHQGSVADDQHLVVRASGSP